MTIVNKTEELKIPTGLSREGRRAAQVIARVLRESFGETASTGGCRTFYTPKEWADRGERYGKNAELIVVYDGGDLRPFMSLDAAYDLGSYSLHTKMTNALRDAGMYPEECTGWYCAIYRD